LDYKGLVSDTLALKLGRFDERVSSQKFLDAVVDTKSGTFSTSLNASLVDEFTSAASFSVDVFFSFQLDVSVFNPGHDLLVGTHVRSEAIDTRPNETLLGELHGVSTSDLLELLLRVVSWLDGNTTLGSSERHVSDTQFVGHQSG